MDEVVTISPKYQVVIPRAIRQALGLRPGQKVWAVLFDERIEYIPIRSLKSMRGFLRRGDAGVRRGEGKV